MISLFTRRRRRRPCARTLTVCPEIARFYGDASSGGRARALGLPSATPMPSRRDQFADKAISCAPIFRLVAHRAGLAGFELDAVQLHVAYDPQGQRLVPFGWRRLCHNPAERSARRQRTQWRRGRHFRAACFARSASATPAGLPAPNCIQSGRPNLCAPVRRRWRWEQQQRKRQPRELGRERQRQEPDEAQRRWSRRR